MDSEIVRGKPLSKEETKSLLGLIENNKVILSKTTNATNNKMKTEEWLRLANCFNATAAVHRRTPQQLRLKWENLKKKARKRSKIRMNRIQTGGGAPEYIPPDDVLDRVADLLGSSDVPGGNVATAGNIPNVATAGKKKTKSGDDGKAPRDIALAEFYKSKKLCVDAKLQNILLQYENLKLKNEKLKLENENWKLENEKL